MEDLLSKMQELLSDPESMKQISELAQMFQSGEVPESAPHMFTRDAVRGAMGQGNNAYTTTQLARYVSTIANSGTPVTKDSLVSFKFTGTRVDLYMNTTPDDEFVAAYILDADGNFYEQEGIKTFQLVTGKSSNNLKNVPVISFKGLDRGTYTLAVAAPVRSSYTLDGVRVYDESRASYASVRETLLGAEDWTGEYEVSGTVYLDYGKDGSAEKADYNDAGPKGEVYLKSGNGVAFTIDGYSSSASYRIGLASANGTPVTAYINGTPYTVSSTTHMFYDLHPSTEGNVVIRVNTGAGILSVTDVEAVPPLTAGKLSFSVSPQLMSFAESMTIPDEPVETPEVTPDPTPDLGALIQQLISSFVESLFSSISRLFG